MVERMEHYMRIIYIHIYLLHEKSFSHNCGETLRLRCIKWLIVAIQLTSDSYARPTEIQDLPRLGPAYRHSTFNKVSCALQTSCNSHKIRFYRKMYTTK